jgi:hypothetical protein
MLALALVVGMAGGVAGALVTLAVMRDTVEAQRARH